MPGTRNFATGSLVVSFIAYCSTCSLRATSDTRSSGTCCVFPLAQSDHQLLRPHVLLPHLAVRHVLLHELDCTLLSGHQIFDMFFALGSWCFRFCLCSWRLRQLRRRRLSDLVVLHLLRPLDHRFQGAHALFGRRLLATQCWSWSHIRGGAAAREMSHVRALSVKAAA